MIWIEIVCDGCNDNPWGERYRKGSLTRLKQNVKHDGWKTIKGKIYCPKCIQRIKESEKSDNTQRNS